MKRHLIAALTAAIALCAVAAPASAHVVTVAQGGLTCTGITVKWTSFPGGPFNLNLAFQDQVGSMLVKSPYIVAGLTGASGSQALSAPAGSGVTYRKVTITWSVDGGGSTMATATVKCPTTPPINTTTTGTTSTTTTPMPVQTVTITTTVPGPATTVTVTAPGKTTTVAGPVTTVTGPTTTVTSPGVTKAGATRTIIRYRTKVRTKITYRALPVTVKCPKGYAGSSVFPINKANKLMPGKPILAVCKRIPHSVQDTGVTG